MAINGTLLDANSVPGNRLKDNAAVLRTQLNQETLAPFAITPLEWRVWDAPGTLIGTAANDDLGLAAGTFGTDVIRVTAGDLEAAGATTRRAITRQRIPVEYDDGETLQIRVRAGMVTNAADTSCTVDLEVYKVDRSADGTAGSDLCTTAAQDMNSLTEADFDFTVTPTDLASGDELEIRLSIACNDAGTGTAVTPIVYKAELLCDVRG